MPIHGQYIGTGPITEHRITVLLIDDQAMMGEAVRRMLSEEKDIAFHFCQDPTRAIQVASEVSPTIILQDLVMPDIDGLTLVKFFRANERTRDIPLIVLSAREEPAIKAESFALGANDYLVKFPDKIELIARIRYHSRGYIARLERNEAYTALLESQQALTNELNQAAEYVRSLLPPPLDGDDIKTDWTFIPSTSLGGDSFGYHWIDEAHFAMYLLDVCGHGVGAALLSISALNALRSESLPGIEFRDPSQVLGTLNNTYQMEAHNNMFFTIWYGVYNRIKREVVYASGGHPPAIAVMGDPSVPNKTDLLSTDGVIIGGLPSLAYRSGTFEISPPSKLYVFSDGAYEITRPDGSVGGLDDFVQMIKAIPYKKTSAVQDIMREIRSAQGSDLFADDISLVEFTFG
jgi:sigma-B regulation protein RsbU (phosphoserine phosphatase)